ncbi:molecular chaperone Tir [Pannonibacter phragmitetus]|uniref:TIR domain-containing protein n=1 Tax=Pannonibacter phragmitetus TaxID=121719 RepID=UPI00067D341D|nr:TIR domain-containing protein [Pannonibacter phragmitetus]KND18806.1 molecular chaperone Tir [Pannonibacter phragmitetus]
MSYRNKTYIAFDGDTDMHYYRLMTAWKAHDGNSFNFHNAHDLNNARDTSLEESIKKQLRERFANSKLFILLIGEKTKNLHKFVRWEIEVALSLGLPIIAVNLNGSRQRDDRCPAILRDELAIFVTFNPRIIEHAMANWPTSYQKHKRDGTSGSRHYVDSVYSGFGL